MYYQILTDLEVAIQKRLTEIARAALERPRELSAAEYGRWHGYYLGLMDALQILAEVRSKKEGIDDDDEGFGHRIGPVGSID